MVAVFHSTAYTSSTAEVAPVQTGTSTIAEEEVEQQLDLELHQIGDEAESRKTHAKVSLHEKGKETEPDTAAMGGVPSSAKDLVAKIAEHRRQLAEKLCDLTDRVIASHGRVAMAADIQLLKRELSRGHELLGHSMAESDYLSVITLVEASIASMDWKRATKQQLRNVRTALSVGSSKKRVVFDNYNKAIRMFRGQMLPTTPTFEIDFDEDEKDAE